MKKSTFFKRLVSGERKRYTSDGHDIDLSYICSDRIIVMSFPASGLASNWRNNIKDVSTYNHLYFDPHLCCIH